MRTVRRLLYIEVLGAVAFVTVAFLALFYFLDLVDQLGDVGRGAYRVQHAALYCLLELPSHFYELFPIAVLIGTTFALARLAQSSEFTILRTGGLGPGRALGLLAMLGLAAAVLTFVVGDYVAPQAGAYGDAMKATLKYQQTGQPSGRRASAWLKDRRSARPGETPAGERLDSIHVGHVGPDGRLEDVDIYEFGPDSQLLRRVRAARGVAGTDGWQLEDVRITRWESDGDEHLSTDETRAALAWPATLTRSVVAAAVAPLRSMSTLDLYRYSSHLSDNEQAVQRQQIQFWKKALYPLACLVMVGLALPFAYLHARGGGVSVKVFGGILLGISFVLLNNVSTHLGLLRDWTPWIAAAAPSAFYLLLSMAAFSWLVRYR
ncbi:MAG TPA: LPS export ABC transporter permease LptG [Methylibium sp.]|nr:LPS export ABC transporter permease LptG [Methylibium sp.]